MLKIILKNSKIQTTACLVLLAICTFTLYSKTLKFDFTFLDDDRYILRDGHFLKNISNLPKIFTQDVFLSKENKLSSSGYYYRPMLITSFMLDYQIYRKKLSGYLLTNIILHILNGYLIFSLLQKLSYSLYYRFSGTLLFLSHPLLTQSIAWLPGRNETLLVFFFLLSFHFLLNYLKDQKKQSLILHSILFFFAFLTKETAIIYPVIFIAYILLFHKNFFHRKEPLIFCWTSVIVLAFILRFIALGQLDPLSGSKMLTPFALLKLGRVTTYFLSKAFFPFQLSPMRYIKDTIDIYGVVSFLFLATIVFIARKSKLLWFGVITFISSILIPVFSPTSFIIESRAYLALFGFLLIILEFIKHITQYFIRLALSSSQISHLIKLALLKTKYIAIVCLILLCGWYSYLINDYSSTFSDGITFWSYIIKTSPKFTPSYSKIAFLYHQNKEYKEAEKYYKEALKYTHKKKAPIYLNLAALYFEQKYYEASIEMLKRAIKHDQQYKQAHDNLAEISRHLHK